MREVRVHARAGQGAITTAGILGSAIFRSGRYAYAFPYFGAARMGAPMNAFLRYDDKQIRLRCQVYEPDFVLIVDKTLTYGYDCFAGLKPEGVVIIDDDKENLSQYSLPQASQKIFAVPASRIAQEVIGRPLGNTVILGAFAAATGEVDLDNLLSAVEERFSSKGEIAEKNKAAVKKGFDYIKENY